MTLVQIKHQVKGCSENIIFAMAMPWTCLKWYFRAHPPAELFAIWSRMLPLISLAAREASSSPELGCENWPGKINLSCLFSFCPLLIMAIIKIILLSVVFSGSCFGSSCSILIQLLDMQNVCEEKLNILFSNCRMRERDLKYFIHLLPRSCFVGSQLDVPRDKFIATWNIKHLSNLISFKLIRCTDPKKRRKNAFHWLHPTEEEI